MVAARLSAVCSATIRATSSAGRSGVSPQATITASQEGSSAREADLGRVPGAELLLLHRDLDPGGQGVADDLGAVADDHHRVRDSAPVEGVEDPADHRATGERVHHLRQCRPHPGSLAGGEDDGADAHAVLVSVPGKNVESLPGWGGRIRTPDRGTKTRCLTPWLRPSSRRP